MDCDTCAARGKLEQCRVTECAHYGNWYATELAKENERLKNCLRQLWHKPHEVRGIFTLAELTNDEKDREEKGKS